jgi:hypothetical protein
LVNESIVFPRAGQENLIFEHLYDELTVAYTLCNSYESPAESLERAEFITFPTGNSSSRPGFSARFGRGKRNSKHAATQRVELPTCFDLLLEAYYRGTSHTFRSRSLVRRIAQTALLRESNDEASLAIKTYTERDKKDKQGEWWSRNEGSPPSSNPLTAHPLSPKSYDILQGETVGDVINMFLSGSILLLDSQQTQNGLLYAEKALELCRQHQIEFGFLFMPLAYHHLGLAFSQMAVESKLESCHRMG